MQSKSTQIRPVAQSDRTLTDWSQGAWIGERRFAVEVRVPSVISNVSPRYITNRIINAVKATFRSEVPVSHIEFLSYPDPAASQQTYVLSVIVPTIPDTTDTSDPQKRLHDLISDAAEPTPGSIAHATKLLLGNLQDRLPTAAVVRPVLSEQGGRVPVAS